MIEHEHVSISTHDEVTVLRQRVAELEQRLADQLDHRQKMETVFAYAPVGIVLATMDGRLEQVNAAFEAITAYTAEELIGKSFVEISSPTYTVRDKTLFRELISQQRESFQVEKRYIRKDGQEIWARTHVSLTYNTDGTPQGTIAIIQDITEQQQSKEEIRQLYEQMEQRVEERTVEYKRMEKELQTSQEHFRMIADYTYDWEYFREPNGQFTYMSPACESITGYLIESFLNDAGLLAKLAHPDDTQLLTNCLAAAQEGVTVPPIDIHIVRSDGVERWIQHASQPVYNQDGEWLGTRSSNRDITEQKQAEEMLIRAQFSLDRAADSVYWIREDGYICYANDMTLQELGYSHEELMRLKLDDVDPNIELEYWKANILPMIRQRGHAFFETACRRKDGTIFPAEVSSSYLEYNNKGMICAFVRNITKRKQAEDELRVFKALAERAPDAIGIATFDGIMTYANPVFRTMFGYGDDTLGMINTTLFTEADQRERIPIVFEVGMREGSWIGFLTGQRKDGSTFPAQLSMTILRDADGKPFAVPAIVRDMTEQWQADAERYNLQMQVINAQQAALRELSAPLLPISNTIVIMPLIGSIDTQRAQQIMETLLEGVAQHRAEVAIVDITGVQVVDTQVANALVQTAQAVQLLGAQVILTGIGPAMAQTLVHLGADLSSIITRGSLQSAIAWAMHVTGHR